MSIAGILLVTQPSFLFKQFGPLGYTYTKLKLKDTNQTDEFGNHTDEITTALISIHHNRTSWYRSVGMETTTSASNQVDITFNMELNDPWIGYILIILVAMTTTTTIMIVRSERTIADISTRVQLLWIHSIGAFISVCLMGILETPILPSNQMILLFLAGHVVFSFLGSSLYYYSLSLVSGIIVTLITSCGVIFSYFIQYAFLKNSDKIVAFEIPGILLTFFAACLHPVLTVLIIKKRQGWKKFPLITSENSKDIIF